MSKLFAAALLALLLWSSAALAGDRRIPVDPNEPPWNAVSSNVLWNIHNTPASQISMMGRITGMTFAPVAACSCWISANTTKNGCGPNSAIARSVSTTIS